VQFDVFTIFPGIFDGFLGESIIKRAREKKLIDVSIHDIREWTTDRHRSVDDYPYGGGPGMVMMAPPIVEAVEASIPEHDERTEIILLSASGEPFTQHVAQELSERKRIGLICGRYEGIDQRVIEILGAREISIGDYVLTGGELPAAVIIDAVSRLIPGVIQEDSTADESHSSGLLEYPQYTRPFEYRGLTPPEVLLSGHHANVRAWRRQQSEQRTRERRPDLLESDLDGDEHGRKEARSVSESMSNKEIG
jgi:tRNA (guanine37-N1)-methyltransferase